MARAALRGDKITATQKMLAGLQTTIDSEANRGVPVPTTKRTKDAVKSRSILLRNKFDGNREVLREALDKLGPDSKRRPHFVMPSGKIEYASSQSHAATLIGADDLWPTADPAYQYSLTGADPDFNLTGLSPLPPIGIWEFGNLPVNNDEYVLTSPSLTGQLIDGDTKPELIAENVTVDVDHAELVASIIGLEDQGDGLQGIAWESQMKLYGSVNDYAEMAEAVADPTVKMQFSNHSYGTVAGWGDNGIIWRGPLDPPGSQAPFGTDQSPIFEDPEFGAYTIQSKILDDLIAVSKTYLPVYAATNYAHVNGTLSTEQNPLTYGVLLDSPLPGSYPVTTDRNNNPVEWAIDVTIPHAANSGVPAPDAPTNPGDVDESMFEGLLDFGPGIGSDTITSPACSKNVLTVGAAFSFEDRVESASDFALRHFSSRGPTDDGRIKPDLVASSTFGKPTGIFD